MKTTFTAEEVEIMIAYDRAVKKAQYYQELGQLYTWEKFANFLWEIENEPVNLEEICKESKEFFE